MTFKSNSLLLAVFLFSCAAFSDISINKFPGQYFSVKEDVFQISNENIFVAQSGKIKGTNETGVNLTLWSPNGFLSDFGSISVFTTDWYPPESPALIFTQKDKKIIMAVIAAKEKMGWYYLNLVRFLPDGKIDSGFGDKGIISLNEKPKNTLNHFIRGMFQGPNSKIYVVTQTNNGWNDGNGPLVLQRFNESDGSMDKRFGQKELGFDLRAKFEFHPSSNGFYLSAVDIVSEQNYIYKFNWNGDQEKNYVGGTKKLDQTNEALFQSMEVLNDDKVLLTGGKSNGSLAMTRLLANGQIDTSFGLNGYLDEKESKNFGVFPASVGWGSGSGVSSCGNFRSSLGGKTISDNNSIYVVAPLAISSSPSVHARTKCPISKVAIGIAQYSLDGKLLKTEQSPETGEAYAAWKLRVSKLSLDSSGNIFGVFQLGDHAPNDLFPSLKEVVTTFTIKR